MSKPRMFTSGVYKCLDASCHSTCHSHVILNKYKITGAYSLAIAGKCTMNSRTYSRKSSKRKQNTGIQTHVSEVDHRVRKRQKVDVEVMPSTTKLRSRLTSRSVSPTRKASTDIEEEPNQDPSPSRAKPTITYGSNKSSLPASGPSTPSKPKPARDLSQIFDSAVTPTRNNSPSPSPNKLAKRMLARSRTESSLGSPNHNASHSSMDRTPSLPALLSHLSKSARPTTSLEPTPPPLPPPIPVASTNTRTYAGKSRSFLVSLPTASFGMRMSTGIADGPGEDEEEDDFTTRESYTSLRTRWGVDISEDDPHPSYPSHSPSPIHSNASSPAKGKGKAANPALSSNAALPNGMMNPLKSITELRSKGESRRFLDEVGYLFEGMNRAGGFGLRRARCVSVLLSVLLVLLVPRLLTVVLLVPIPSTCYIHPVTHYISRSALEIVTKLCDADFSRKAKAADFLGRTWDVLRDAGAGDGDKVRPYTPLLLRTYPTSIYTDQQPEWMSSLFFRSILSIPSVIIPSRP